MDLLERAKQKLDNINLDKFLELEEPKKEQIKDLKSQETLEIT